MFCEHGLQVESNNQELSSLLTDAQVHLARKQELDRKAAAADAEKQKAVAELDSALRGRGIVVGSNMLPIMKDFPGKIVLDIETGDLLFSVLFLYEEYMETDFVQTFRETETLLEHLTYMFAPESPPGWDVECKYTIDRLEVYALMNKVPRKGSKGGIDFPMHSADDDHVWAQIPLDTCLMDVVRHPQYVVPGYPAFHILVAGSQFQKEFFKRASQHLMC
mmetsp:Transcript_18476/g.30378  ORF Transcript_18476/g.30378 Transcript_18476/m.30378 type:complete len:220 (+) Transcript_18476:351-1010(+)